VSDVNTFIETIGKDVDATVKPKVQTFVETVGTRTFNEYGPRVAAFASELAKQILDEQSASVQAFATELIQELFQRYRPEITGELHATMVQGAVQVEGRGVSLDMKRRDTGASVATLDIPVAIVIKVPDLNVTLQKTRLQLNVINK
jgi:hypothetical protein